MKAKWKGRLSVINMYYAQSQEKNAVEEFVFSGVLVVKVIYRTTATRSAVCKGLQVPLHLHKDRQRRKD